MTRKILVPLVLPADPAAALEAATKQYVDARVADTGDTMTGALLIHATGVGFRNRQANGTTEGVVIDSTTSNGGIQTRNGLNLATYSDNAGATMTFRVNGADGSHYGGGSAPTIAPAAALGTTATATIQWANDAWMYVILNPNGTGLATGTLATVTFATARTSANYGVWVQPNSANAVDFAKWYAGTYLAGSFAIIGRTVPTAGQTYHLLLWVGGMA